MVPGRAIVRREGVAMVRACLVSLVGLTLMAGCGIKDEPVPLRVEEPVRSVPPADSKVGTAALIDGEVEPEEM